MREYGEHLKCFVSYYNVFTPAVFRRLLGATGGVAPSDLAITDLVAARQLVLPATLVVRSGKDDGSLNADLDAFVSAALTQGVSLELHAYGAGQHGFDVVDNTAESRAILTRTLEFVERRLAPPK
jgi:dienelactone hydrolase